MYFALHELGELVLVLVEGCLDLLITFIDPHREKRIETGDLGLWELLVVFTAVSIVVGISWVAFGT